MDGQVDPNNTSTSYCSMNITGQLNPNSLEIIAPPSLIAATFIAGLVVLRITTSRTSKKKITRFKRLISQNEDNSADINLEDQDEVRIMFGNDVFFSDFDYEVLDRVTYDYNHFYKLVWIALPSCVVLILGFLTIWMRNSIIGCIWPHRQRPDINTALTCFLAPAGLVFALSYGFVFAEVLEKHAAVYQSIANELSWLDQILTMIQKFHWSGRRNSLAMIKAVKSELIVLGALVLDREPSEFKHSASKNIKVHIWTMLDILHKEEEHGESKFNLNSILADRMVDYLIYMNSICTDRMGALHTGIHPLKWLFLELLANISIFGVLMVDGTSAMAELAFCQMTAISIAMLFYLLADFDSPFNGLFRVTTAIIPEVIGRADQMYQTELYEMTLDQAREDMTETLKEKGKVTTHVEDQPDQIASPSTSN